MNTFTIKGKINFYDCDPAGIIFYSKVFLFFHSAYEELISELELKKDYWKNDDYVVPIVHTDADFIKPLKYGDEIEVTTQVLQLKTSSFELGYNILKNGEVCCKGKTVHVFVDKKNWKKKELTKEIAEGLKKYLVKN